MEMDWAQLNPDLLCLIANKVGDIPNFIRLRVVCRHWRSAVHPSFLPPQLPCMFFPGQKTKETPTFDLKLFNPYSNKTHHLCSSETLFTTCFSDTSGYLWSSSMFFNPITRMEVPVPSDVCCYQCANSINHKGRYNPSPTKHSMEIMFGSCVLQQTHTTSLWRYSKQEWTRIFRIPFKYKGMVTYYKGLLYKADMDIGETTVVDVTTEKVLSVIAHPDLKFDYLIEASGHILGIRMWNLLIFEFQLEIYRLDSTKNPRWVKLNEGIGDMMLFLDAYRKIGFCLKARDFPGFRGNCVYVMFCSSNQGGRYKFIITRYDLDEKKVEALSSHEDLEYSGTWFVPSLC